MSKRGKKKFSFVNFKKNDDLNKIKNIGTNICKD